MCTKTLCSLDTGYYADTVEWCPVGGFESYLVCGTYQLLEKSERDEENPPSPKKSLCSSSSVRVGNVQLYYLDETLGRLDNLQSFETGGVLDTKWLPTSLSGYPVLGGVTSNGELKIFFLKEKKLTQSTSYTTSPGKLCLSLDWSPKAENSLIAVSDSAGQITVCQFVEGTSDLCQILQWTGHQYEAWITAFDVSNSSVVYSGGDDCLLQGWDTRTDCHKPSFTSKRHDMGVSSIQCNICHEYIMATGSYDESIHVWDTRSMRQPLCSSRPGGGIWRIKWHPVHGNTMLTACMYEGFHILNFSHANGDQCLKKSVSYQEQASLAYGADWCRNKTLALTELRGQTVQQSEENSEFKESQTFESNTDLVATCSFYDHALNLWQVNL